MPIAYETDHDRRRIVAVATGAVGTADITAFIAAIVQQQCAHYVTRLDARAAEILVTAAQVRGFVTLMARTRAAHGHVKSAVVTDADVAFGMARMYATLAAESDTGFMVYRTIDEADTWLGWVEARSLRQPG